MITLEIRFTPFPRVFGLCVRACACVCVFFLIVKNRSSPFSQWLFQTIFSETIFFSYAISEVSVPELFIFCLMEIFLNTRDKKDKKEKKYFLVYADWLCSKAFHNWLDFSLRLMSTWGLFWACILPWACVWLSKFPHKYGYFCLFHFQKDYSPQLFPLRQAIGLCFNCYLLP